MDGYLDGYIGWIDLPIVDAEFELAGILASHIQTRHRLREIDVEMSSFYNPFDSEGWVTSIPDMNGRKSFKISDFKKISKLRREYRKLKETDERNLRFLKLKQIDGVIHQLEVLNKKSDGT